MFVCFWIKKSDWKESYKTVRQLISSKHRQKDGKREMFYWFLLERERGGEGRRGWVGVIRNGAEKLANKKKKKTMKNF